MKAAKTKTRIQARCNVQLVVNPTEVDSIARLLHDLDSKLIQVNYDTCTVCGFTLVDKVPVIVLWALDRPTTCVKINV